MDLRQRVSEIDRILKQRYPETTNLAFTNPFNLLVAAILAAQCTDERVNRVTEKFFERYPEPTALADAPLDEIEEAVRSTGYYRQKARTLQSCSRELVERYQGRVPDDPDELTTLPGVGRKTANLVLGNSLGIPGVFVDTHVKRVSHRLGLTKNTNPDKIEVDLTPLIDPHRQVAFSNLITHLGRDVCTARKPQCDVCPVTQMCPKVGVASQAS